MRNFFENVFSGVGITDVIDIIIVAFVIYKLLGLIKQTRAEQLMKGVLLLVVATFLSGFFNLHTINWLLNGAVMLGAVAILVVFQPELRRALEYMGRSKIVKAPLKQMDKEKGKQITAHIIKGKHHSMISWKREQWWMPSCRNSFWGISFTRAHLFTTVR